MSNFSQLIDPSKKWDTIRCFVEKCEEAKQEVLDAKKELEEASRLRKEAVEKQRNDDLPIEESMKVVDDEYAAKQKVSRAKHSHWDLNDAFKLCVSLFFGKGNTAPDLSDDKAINQWVDVLPFHERMDAIVQNKEVIGEECAELLLDANLATKGFLHPTQPDKVIEYLDEHNQWDGNVNKVESDEKLCALLGVRYGPDTIVKRTVARKSKRLQKD